MKSLRSSASRIYAATTLAAILAGSAAEAHAAQDTETPQARESVTTSGDIVVTARRREESQTDVPISITVASAEELQRANVTNLSDIGKVAPAVRSQPVAGRLGTLSFAIRGQVDLGGLVSSDPAVGIYFADAIMARAQGTASALYDLQSIQVLKGAQGTLFGRNLTGGAILIQPAQARLDEVEGYIQGIYGSFDRMELQGAVNVPIGDSVALRIAGNITRRDGYIRNLTTGSWLGNDHNDAFRVTLRIKPSDEFENVLIVDGQQNDMFGLTATPFAVNPAVNLPFNTYASRLAVLQRQQARSVYDIEDDVDPRTAGSNIGVTNTSTVNIGSVTVKNIFNWRRVKSEDISGDGFPQSFVRLFSENRATQVSEELQVQGKALDDRLIYVAGGYFFYEEGYQNGSVAVLGGNPRINRGPVKNESRSIFAQLDFEAVPGLTFTAGGRYTWDYRSLAQLVIDATGVTTVNTYVAKSFKEPTWTLVASYKPADNVNLYITNRRGYRSGGFNSGAVTLGGLKPIQPEFVTDYEIGAKARGQLAGVRFDGSIAAFHSDFTNIQRQVAVLEGTPPAPSRVLINAAEGQIRGVEGALTISPTSFLDLSGSFAYTDAKYSRFLDPITGADLSYLPYSQTPKWSYRLAASIAIPVADSIGQPTLNIDYSSVSEIFISDTTSISPGGLNPGYDLLGVRLGIAKVGNSPLDIAVFGNNLTKSLVPLAASPFYPAPFGFSAVGYAPSRTYGVEVRLNF